MVFDNVFVFLDVRDNDCSGYEDARTKFERKACPVAQIKPNLTYKQEKQLQSLIKN